MVLTKVDSKAQGTFNEDDPASQKPVSYPKTNSNDVPISRETFLHEQARDPHCQQYASYVQTADSNISYDSKGYLVRIARLYGALQIIVPANLRKRVLYLAHYLLLEGHASATRMFHSLRREFYWRFMASNVFYTVCNCQSCTKARSMLTTVQKYLLLFPANSPLEFVAMDILVPIPKK